MNIDTGLRGEENKQQSYDRGVSGLRLWPFFSPAAGDMLVGTFQ